MQIVKDILYICQKICDNIKLLYKRYLNKKKLYYMLTDYMKYKKYAVKPFIGIL